MPHKTRPSETTRFTSDYVQASTLYVTALEPEDALREQIAVLLEATNGQNAVPVYLGIESLDDLIVTLTHAAKVLRKKTGRDS